jgi:hypothetical protein
MGVLHQGVAAVTLLALVASAPAQDKEQRSTGTGRTEAEACGMALSASLLMLGLRPTSQPRCECDKTSGGGFECLGSARWGGSVIWRVSTPFNGTRARACESAKSSLAVLVDRSECMCSKHEPSESYSCIAIGGR